jgi:hypothetical protein
MTHKGNTTLHGKNLVAKKRFSEDDFHKFVYEVGLKGVITSDFPIPVEDRPAAQSDGEEPAFEGEPAFELWRMMRERAVTRLAKLHDSIRYGQFIGSKIRLPTGEGKRMELDLLGTHEGGLFVLELKIDKTAERNAFSELFGYSNYIAEAAAASGRRDITNVLVAKLDNEITRHAFLYDLLIAGRDIIVYKPVWEHTVESLKLEPYLPDNAVFRRFSNRLLSHEAMSCVVASFHDLEGWYDSKEESNGINDYTKEHLSQVTTYAAQLMEAEGLHGFCVMRKPWQEHDFLEYRNSLIICAINPFEIFNEQSANVAILEQLTEVNQSAFFEVPRLGFLGRLIDIAQRAVRECLDHGLKADLECPLWSGMVTSTIEVAIQHLFGFRPTGIMREAYSSHLRTLYAANAAGQDFDLELLQGNEIFSWFRAWLFMEQCGFIGGAVRDEADDDVEDDV